MIRLFVWTYFSFQGRIDRKPYFGAVSLAGVASELIAFLSAQAENENPLAALVSSPQSIVSTWVLAALAAKRLHDLGLPGLLAIVPVAGPAFVEWAGGFGTGLGLGAEPISGMMFLVLSFWKGTEGANDYGPRAGYIAPETEEPRPIDWEARYIPPAAPRSPPVAVEPTFGRRKFGA